MSHLPHDIIINILLHLPVKSLVKFRCVSKSWLSLISDPHFAKNHLLCNQTTNQRLLLVCDGDSKSFTLKSCSLSSLFDSPSPSLTVATEAVHFFEESYYRIRVIGSCNGLLCIAIDFGPKPDLYLWNPTTREHRKLPPVVGFTVEYDYSETYGFGYVSCIDDYKVVAIVEREVMIYTLRSDRWRRIDVIPFDLSVRPGLLVGGALSWIGVGLDLVGVEWHIIALDLATEDYYIVSKPPNEFDPKLVELGECLCLLAHHNRDHVDIWMMKEYGVEEPWFKMATVPYSYDQDEPWATEHHIGTSYLPLSCGKNAELLLEFQSGLVLYNPNTNAFRMPVIDNLEHYSESFTFVESLVSPNVRRD